MLYVASAGGLLSEWNVDYGLWVERACDLAGRDLTEAARRGKLDPVIGRDEEIRRVVGEILDAWVNRAVIRIAVVRYPAAGQFPYTRVCRLKTANPANMGKDVKKR